MWPNSESVMEDSEAPVTEPKPEGEKPDAVGAVITAGESGKLDALKSLMDEMGWPTSGEELIMLAQKDERTRGKSPEELAQMIRDDNSLYDDLVAYGPGGALEKMGAKEPESAAEEQAEPEPDIEGFSAEEQPKARKALKSMGKSKKEVDGDYDTKRDFMTRMAE